MSLGAFLQGVTSGVQGGLQDVQQVQQIRAEGQKQSAQADAARYMQDAIKNGTDPMDVAQNMAAFSMRAGDQQAASHWYGVYNDQKAVKTGHALVGAYAAADQGDPDLAAASVNHYNQLAGIGDKVEVVPHVDPVSGQETRTVAVSSPDGRRTVLPPDQWQTIAKAKLAIELSNLKTQQEMPYQQRVWGAQAGNLQAQTGHTQAMTPVDVAKGTAEAGNIEAQTVTEQQKPGLVRAQTGLAQQQGGYYGAEAGATRATTPGKVALLGAQAGATNAEAGLRGEQARTESALRSGQVSKVGAEAVEAAARAGSYAEDAQNKRIALPSENALRDAQARLAQEHGDYLERGGRAPAPRGPSPWTKEDQTSMDAAIDDHIGMGTDLGGQRIKTGEPSDPALANPNAQRAMRPLTQSLMTAPGNRDSLRNNAAGAAELAAAIISGRAQMGHDPKTGKLIANYGGITYEVPPAAMSSARANTGGPQNLAPSQSGGPSVPMQRY